jgi:protein O-mannosyl-transferase
MSQPVLTKKNLKKEKSAKLRMNMIDLSTHNTKWMLPFILGITFIAYIPSLGANFVNWDDGDYAYNNIFIRTFNLKDIFTTPVQGNYHPLTMLTLAINYQVSGLNPWSYHLLNIIFHLINSILVFNFILQLSKGNRLIAFTTSVLFAIHPMHVESVAWVAERKDVLYTLFFVAGLSSYVKFVDTRQRKHYFFALGLMILSLLSKPAAVVFPMVLFAIDFLRKREFTVGVMLEKIPFLLPAIAMGGLTYLTQKSVGAAKNLFPFGKQMLLGFYGIMAYFIKMIFPFNLSNFYPFPAITAEFTGEYYVAPVFSVLLAILFYYSYKRERVIAFGIAFYLINLILVLQFLGVGSAVIAERYTYVSYIGPFFIFGSILFYIAKSYKSYVNIVIGISIIFAGLTFKQAITWKDSRNMWTQAIKNTPSYTAFLNMAAIEREDKNLDLALEYYSEAIRLNGGLGDAAYTSRGNIYNGRKEYDLALYDFRKAVSIKPGDATAWHNIGVVYADKQIFDSSIYYYNIALEKDSGYGVAYNSRGVSYMKMDNYEKAIADFETYLKFKPNAPETYNIISTCYRFWLKQDKAIEFANKAIAIDPDPNFILNRAHAYGAMGNYELARKDVITAREKGLAIDPHLLFELKIE